MTKPCPSCGSKDIHLFACPKYDPKVDNVEKIVEYSIKKYGVTYKKLGEK